jgi:hypothetical protein
MDRVVDTVEGLLVEVDRDILGNAIESDGLLVRTGSGTENDQQKRAHSSRTADEF